MYSIKTDKTISLKQDFRTDDIEVGQSECAIDNNTMYCVFRFYDYDYVQKNQESVLNEINTFMKNAINPEQKSENKESEAYKNAVSAMFDGIKYIADRDNPAPITFPMYVRANMYYKYNGKVYICFKTGIIDSIDDNYLEED